MKNLKRSVFLLVAALCLLAACNSEPGDDQPSVNLSALSPSALPSLEAGVTPITDQTEALALVKGAVDALPDALEMIRDLDDYDEEYSIRGHSVSRAVYSESIGPYEYHNDKNLVPGASVTGYYTGSHTINQKKNDEPSPGDSIVAVVDSKIELDLLDGITEDGVNVKGTIAEAVYVKTTLEYSEDGSIPYVFDINQQSVYALTVTDMTNNTGGRFILEFAVKGKLEMSFNLNDLIDDETTPDLSKLAITARLKGYDNNNTELFNIDIAEETDIFDHLKGLDF
jgi:hypothetical protein